MKPTAPVPVDTAVSLKAKINDAIILNGALLKPLNFLSYK